MLMAVNGWLQVEMAKNGLTWKGMEMAGNGRKRLEMSGLILYQGIFRELVYLRSV